MAETNKLTVERRDAKGKGESRRLREKDVIPGVYYDTENNIPVQVEEMPLYKLYKGIGSTKVFDLEIAGGDGTVTKPALIWELTMHPFKNKIQHVDFFGVDLEKKIKIQVPVEFKGVPKGVKVGGGILEEHRESVEILSLPMDIPPRIVVDVSALEVNDMVHVADLELPEGVEVVYDQNFALVSVQMTGKAKAAMAKGGAGAEETEEEAEA